MNSLHAFLYGAVQGLTEYLPVSSSAHLLLLPHFLAQADPGLAFDVFLHIGTLLATLIYFWREWVIIIKQPLPSPSSKNHATNPVTWLHLFVGTLPAVLVGAVAKGFIEAHTRSLSVVYVTLPLFGLLLWWVDRQSARTRSLQQATIRDFFIIGCAQVLALIPGVSRSGSTLTAARYLGFDRSHAAKISFLLSVPVTLGAIVFELRHLDQVLATIQGFAPLIVGCVSALVFGALAIKLMLGLVARLKSYAVFAIYRAILAGLVAYLLT